MKIILNRCFGGFGLSKKAYERWIKAGAKVTGWTIDGNFMDKDAHIVDWTLNKKRAKEDKLFIKFHKKYSMVDREKARLDPKLIKIVEEMGKSADGRSSKLKVIEIPDDIEYEIDEYDGVESVHEKHRSWC